MDAVDENNTFYTEGEGYITFVDLQGNKTSGKLLDSKMSHAYRIFLIDNNLMISGLTPGAEDYALMKTDLYGDTDWIKTYGGDNMDHCFAMDIGSDNSVFLSEQHHADRNISLAYYMRENGAFNDENLTPHQITDNLNLYFNNVLLQ